MAHPHNVILASYGNDSVALIQWAHEHGLRNVWVLFSDTGWAHPAWAGRIKRCEAWAHSLGFETARTTSIGLEALVRQKKGWPRQGMQFCTYELKIKPAMAWLDKYDPVGLATCLVGVRRAESVNRRTFPEKVLISPNHGDRICWAPLIDHSDEERDALLQRAGFKPLPHRSRECFPCINENRAGIRQLDEETIVKVETIETDLGFTSKGKPRTMFRPYRHMGATGIREMVRWAKSPRGEFDPDDGTGGGNCDSGFCGT